MYCFYLVLALASVFASTADQTLRIETSSGILHGREEEFSGKKLRVFLGVPYAQSPIASLRFKEPQPLDTPNTERNATKFGPSCVQPRHVASVISPLLRPNKAAISEDCLFLNIYVPTLDNSDDSLPVMVWLAGEGFDYADPQQYDGKFLAVNGQVIVVTVNYRLSAFGFLTTLSDDAPSNNGLNDQRMALKWIKQNINQFGGNSLNVTLFGRFTGSMSAAIHTFSPFSLQDNTFQSVVLQSGFPDGVWDFNSSPLNLTYDLASKLNCSSSELTQILSCLKEKTSFEILHASMQLGSKFRPTIDYKLIHGNIINALKSNQYAPIPVMVGLNENEGTLCSTALKAMNSEYFHKFQHENLTDSDFSYLISYYMNDFYKINSTTANSLVEFIYKDSKVSTHKNFLRFCGDLFINSRAEAFSVELTRHNIPIYVYNFKHRPSFSSQPSYISSGHGDDVLFSLGLTLQLDELPDEEANLTKNIISSFANFAKTGNPNSEEDYVLWPQYTEEERFVFDFVAEGNVSQIVHRSPHEKMGQFWTEVVPPVIEPECN